MDDLCDLHLISWNVAGLKTTLEQLRRFGFAGFLKRHRADVLCLQEVKLSSKALSAGGGRQFDVEGFESFWCCNDGLGSQRQGLNGVCTFARAGLVLHADNAPLGCEELDGEGRCLLTDHGAFVVFNVYVPNSAGGRLPYKLRWLRALRHAMWRERSKGKAVLLAGDLNLKHRVLDSHWTCLGVRPAVLDLADAPEEVRQQLARWEQLFAALRQKWVEPLETRNSRNGQTFQKFGVWAQPLPPGCSSASGDGQRVRLGPPVDSKEMAQLSFPLDGVGVDEDGQLLVAVPNPAYVLREPGEISLGELVEGFKKLAGVLRSVR
ncbi:unnamed protein product [Effrenium voratum]|uniref:Endonuclease/exonuclease/phosphatase domain-containing protein n=1 Tax=Effrenium voratum TaxID=2562239 RepID=A0AA36NJR3_9DINO|nr:unnamed protein product [Effrenium voratum]